MSPAKPFSTTVISLLLALAQLLLVTHTAFVTHSISGTGEHHHSSAAATQQGHARHSGPTATWCSEHVELKPADDLACTAAKCGTVCVTELSAPSLSSDQAASKQRSPAFAFTRNPLSVLSCSPKASPPSTRLS